MSRSVDNVAKQILSIVPVDSELYIQINKFIENLWNQAPEALYSSYNWTKFCQVLNTYAQDDSIDSSLINQIKLIIDGKK